MSLTHLCLNIEGVLLLKVSNFTGNVVAYLVESGIISIVGVKSFLGGLAIGASPGRNRRSSHPGELAVGDGSVTVVPRDHGSMAVDFCERAAVNKEVFSSFDEDGTSALERPVASGGDSVRGVQVGVPCSGEGELGEGKISCRVLVRGRNVEDGLVNGCDEVQCVRRGAGGVEEEVKFGFGFIEEKLILVVKLLENVGDEPVTAFVRSSAALEAALCESD